MTKNEKEAWELIKENFSINFQKIGSNEQLKQIQNAIKTLNDSKVEEEND